METSNDLAASSGVISNLIIHSLSVMNSFPLQKFGLTSLNIDFHKKQPKLSLDGMDKLGYRENVINPKEEADMADQLFKVTCKVTLDNLPSLLGTCELLNISPYSEIKREVKPGFTRFKNTKLSSRKVVLAFLKKNPRSSTMEIRRAVMAAGYSSNTHSPAVSELRSQGRIVQNPDGTYSLSK